MLRSPFWKTLREQRGALLIWSGLIVLILFSFALDNNVHIQETKAATCDIRPGRRQSA